MVTFHKSITIERVMDAVQRHNTTLDDPGFCVTCGADAEGVEPDASCYPCEQCECHSVYGTEQLLIMMA